MLPEWQDGTTVAQNWQLDFGADCLGSDYFDLDCDLGVDCCPMKQAAQ
jgi:hypothetical protein